MIQLIYVSDASGTLAADDVFTIIETSAHNNLRDDLTGFLIFSQRRFFQLVEGPEAHIAALLARLNKDPRHSSIRILSRQTITERAYPRWQMERLNAGRDILRALAESASNGRLPPRVDEAMAEFIAPEMLSAA